MIDALVSGRIFGKPTERTSKAGKPFAVAKMRVAAGDGESTFISIIAFDQQPCDALLALNGTHAPDAMAVSQAQVSSVVSIESWRLQAVLNSMVNSRTGAFMRA